MYVWSKGMDQCEICSISSVDGKGVTQWAHGFCTLHHLYHMLENVCAWECVYVCAHGHSLTLWTVLSLCSLQLKSSLPPFLLSLISPHLRPFLPPFLTLPGHFVGWAVLWAACQCWRQIGRHAAHCDTPPIDHTSSIRHFWEEAAQLQRQKKIVHK